LAFKLQNQAFLFLQLNAWETLRRLTGFFGRLFGGNLEKFCDFSKNMSQLAVGFPYTYCQGECNSLQSYAVIVSERG